MNTSIPIKTFSLKVFCYIGKTWETNIMPNFLLLSPFFLLFSIYMTRFSVFEGHNSRSEVCVQRIGAILKKTNTEGDLEICKC